MLDYAARWTSFCAPRGDVTGAHAIEVTKRWPDWQVDYDNAVMTHTASVRGWTRLPVTIA